MLTSIWENDTTVLQYSYCENINDGRGYTSGRAGFCTGCGDAVQVVNCFDQAYPGSGNSMSKYYSTMLGLAGGDTSALDAIGSYCQDWSASATDGTSGPIFNGCQDQLTQSLYQAPGCQDAQSWGIRTPLFLAELYDAEINHGEPDVSNMLSTAGQQAGVPMSGNGSNGSNGLSQSNESKLLHAFLTVRLGILAADPTWAMSVDRIATYEKERLAGNFDMSQPITTDAHSSTYWPNMNLQNTGYAVCTLSPSGGSVQVTGDAACTQ
jgi:chitosanase